MAKDGKELKDPKDGKKKPRSATTQAQQENTVANASSVEESSANLSLNHLLICTGAQDISFPEEETITLIVPQEPGLWSMLQCLLICSATEIKRNISD